MLWMAPDWSTVRMEASDWSALTYLAGNGRQVHTPGAQENAGLGILALPRPLAQETLARVKNVLETPLHSGQVSSPGSVYLRRQLLRRGDQVTEIHR